MKEFDNYYKSKLHKKIDMKLNKIQLHTLKYNLYLGNKIQDLRTFLFERK